MRKAFSFFELMIVILIIGSVYALLIQNFSFPNEKEKKISLSNLPFFLRNSFSQSKGLISLKCLGDCSVCKIYEDGEEKSELEGLFKKDASPNSYRFVNGYMEKIEFLNVFSKQNLTPVCFEYNIYPNKSGDELFLQYDEKVFYYDNFSSTTMEFESLEDAQEYKRKEQEKIKE